MARNARSGDGVLCALIGESATILVTESFLLTAVSTFNPRVMNVCASWVEIPTPTRSNHSHPVGMSQLADAKGMAMGKVTRGR